MLDYDSAKDEFSSFPAPVHRNDYKSKIIRVGIAGEELAYHYDCIFESEYEAEEEMRRRNRKLKERDIVKVLNAIIKEIPKTENNFIFLLRKVIERAWYTAPEIMKDRWLDAACIINAEIKGTELEEWQQKIVNIWTNKE